jgi:hypothetical protein
MPVKPNYYRQIIKVLEALNNSHPEYNMGKHLATALDGHNIWGLSDKELLQCLKDYKVELEMDIPHKDDDEEEIIKQAFNLNLLFEEEDE